MVENTILRYPIKIKSGIVDATAEVMVTILGFGVYSPITNEIQFTLIGTTLLHIIKMNRFLLITSRAITSTPYFSKMINLSGH